MYHVDITLAISRNTVSDLEDAFRALACREDKVITAKGNEISDGAKRKLLGEICDLLAESERIMPGDAYAKLDLLPGSTHAEGAARVRTLGRADERRRDGEDAGSVSHGTGSQKATFSTICQGRDGSNVADDPPRG